MQYSHYDCQQIMAEQQRVSARVAQLRGDVDSNATGDAVATGVGLILFWPALFFIDGDGPEANEYGRLKGEYEALQKASIEKKCSLAPAPTPTTTATPAAPAATSTSSYSAPAPTATSSTSSYSTPNATPVTSEYSPPAPTPTP